MNFERTTPRLRETARRVTRLGQVWIAASLLVLQAGAAELALAPYRFQFPRDYFAHPGYATEWWYYTGNLSGAHGERFGFELTFFRSQGGTKGSRNPVWAPEQFYLAHFALSDISRKTFRHWERLNRPGPCDDVGGHEISPALGRSKAMLSGRDTGGAFPATSVSQLFPTPKVSAGQDRNPCHPFPAGAWP